MPKVTVRLRVYSNGIELRFILRGQPFLIPQGEKHSKRGHYLNDRLAPETIVSYGYMLSQRIRSIAGTDTVVVEPDNCLVYLRSDADVTHVIERLRQNTTFALQTATPWVAMRSEDGSDWRYRFGSRLLDNVDSISGAIVQSDQTNMTALGRTLCRSVPWTQMGITVNAVYSHELKLAPRHTNTGVDWRSLDTYAIQHVAHVVGTRGIQVDWAS